MFWEHEVAGSSPVIPTFQPWQICFVIGRWPNWLRFVIWDHEIAGSSPVLPTIPCCRIELLREFESLKILYSNVTGIFYAGILLTG